MRGAPRTVLLLAAPLVLLAALLCALSCALSCVIGPVTTAAPARPRKIPRTRPGHLGCWFVDTGTGDATVLVLPSGRTAVIDAGTPDGGEIVARFLRELGIETLDAAVLSHPDYDHYGGLASLVERYGPADFYHSGLTSWTLTYRSFRRAVSKSGCNTHTVRAGDTIPLGEGVSCRVLWPPGDVEPNSTSMRFANNNSLVLRISFGDVSFLFCGDIKGEAEADLLGERRGGLDADVLKVAHHGSASSSSREFLEAVSPALAVIMGERGNYEMGAWGEASPETLRRLEEVGSRILRVCRTGTVLVETDGERITRVVTEAGELLVHADEGATQGADKGADKPSAGP